MPLIWIKYFDTFADDRTYIFIGFLKITESWNVLKAVVSFDDQKLIVYKNSDLHFLTVEESNQKEAFFQVLGDSFHFRLIKFK